MAEIHDGLYSYALLAAFVCGVAAVLLDITLVVVPSLRLGASAGGENAPAQAPPARVAARALLAIATGALLVSVVVHARWGHGSTSAEPMPPGQLLSAHPAFLWAAMLLVFAGVPAALVATLARQRRSGPRP